MFARRIAVIGTGYVGLTTGACLASLGHTVVCADVDVAKVERLRRGEVDILEPDLPEVVQSGLSSGRLEFVVGAREGLRGGSTGAGAEVVFLCVPTPMGAGGSADLSLVAEVVEEIRDDLAPGAVVVTKSTVPVGTSRTLHELIGRDDVAVVSNPEFLREGSAVGDFLDPDRIVVGSDAQDAAERVAALYSRVGAPTVLTDAASAELVKYAANCFLAMKLSYVNALAELCERLGADIDAVTEGLGHDKRIGQAFLRPGPGWGGSCLPKDTEAMLRLADAADFEFRLVRAAIETNERQSRRIVEKVRLAVTGSRSGSLHRTRLGLLGLTFKAGTNDLRDSPALVVAAQLRQAGATVVAFDPVIPAETALPGGAVPPEGVVASAELAVKDVDAVVLLTEWPEFRTLDWGALAGIVRLPVVVDTRNLLDRDVLTRAGFAWHGIGRRPDDRAATPTVTSSGSLPPIG